MSSTSLVTTEYRPDSLIVKSGDYGWAVLAHVLDKPPSQAYIVLHDTGADLAQLTTITCNGVVMSRAQLLSWFPRAKSVRLSVDTDPTKYGFVVNARFTGEIV
jgi:hypothetical protein